MQQKGTLLTFTTCLGEVESGRRGMTSERGKLKLFPLFWEEERKCEERKEYAVVLQGTTEINLSIFREKVKDN